VALTFSARPGLGAVSQIGEAQAMRGHQVRGAATWRRWPRQLLSLGLERGLSLAEAMEARGFGAPGAATGAGHDRRWLIPAGLAAVAGGGLLALGSPWPVLAGTLLTMGSLAIWLGLRAAGPGRSRYRRRRWTWGDTAVTVAAALAIVALVAARLSGDGGLDYAVYPALGPPPVSALGLAATLLLLAPALCAEAGWR
jgi:energy-coupling factor transport system permease protein